MLLLYIRNGALLSSIIYLFSCEKAKNLVLQEYNGPLLEQVDITILHSDSAQTTLKIQAPYELDFESGDKEFPKGIYVEFYDKGSGNITSTLKANKGYYYDDRKLYKGEGNVIVRNLKKKEQLNSEELFWNLKEEKIFTEKFVRIETEDEILLGEGLEASQDFENYTIKNPTGIISIDDDQENR